MAKVRNINPNGDLDVPALGRFVLAGQIIDVPAELLDGFRTDNWEVIPDAPTNKKGDN